MFFRKNAMTSNRSNLNGAFNKITKRFFRNKMTLSAGDMQVIKQQNFLKVNVKKGDEVNLKNKTFIFGKKK